MSGKVEFPWLPYPGIPIELAPAAAFEPRVPIELRANGCAVPVLALIDTGSSETLVPDGLLEPLGLTDPAGRGAADYPLIQRGPVTVEYHEVDLALGPWVATMKLGFAAGWEITHPNPLLGLDVTSKFVVTLDGPGRMTTIERREA